MVGREILAGMGDELAVGIELVTGVVIAERVDGVVARCKDDQELVRIEDR